MPNNAFNYETEDLSLSIAVEASAGTGKTYNIVNIVDRVLKERKDLSIDHILIVTFTDKAVGELNDRITKRLRSVYSKESEGKCGKELEDLKKKYLSRPSIFTIHSFCQSVISEYSLTMNLPSSFIVIDDYRLNEYADIYVHSGKIYNEIVEISSKNYPISFSEVAEYLTDFAKKYYLKLDLKTEDDNVISYEEYNLLGIVYEPEMTFSEFLNANPEFKDYSDKIKNSITLDDYSNYANDQILKLEKEINKLKTEKSIAERRSKIESWKNGEYYSDYVESEKSIIDATLEKSFSAMCKNKFKLYADFQKFITNHPTAKKYGDYFIAVENFLEKEPNYDKAISCKYAVDFYKSWQEYKVHHGYIEFNDMIRYVREKVIDDSCELKGKLREKYTLGLIDEFQDTNQLQYDIFKSIFFDGKDNKSPSHNLIVVGDPKQSIYSFQGADVDVYRKAVTEIVDAPKTLATNYRSTDKMIEACNNLFKGYDDEVFKFNPSNAPEVSGFAKIDGVDISPIWVYDYSEKLSPQDYANYAVKTIIYLSERCPNGRTRLQISYKVKDNKGNTVPKARDVSFKDFAILAKVKSELLPIEAQLRRFGVPFVRYKDDRLFTGLECEHWIALLEAITCADFTGRNRAYFKKALYTKFFGRNLYEVNSDTFDKDSSDEFSMLLKWRDLSNKKYYDQLIDSIINKSKLNDSLSGLDNLGVKNTFIQIGSYASDYLNAGHCIEELIVELKAKYNHSSDDDEGGSIIAKGTDFDCVQLMTMHASKGLQFPVVISVGGFKKRNTRGKVYSKKIDGKNRIVFQRDDDIREQEDQECKRLFYVANTRAEHLLILPYYEKVGYEFINKTLDDYMELTTVEPERVCMTNSVDEPAYAASEFSIIRKYFEALLSRQKDDEKLSNYKKETKICKKLVKDILANNESPKDITTHNNRLEDLRNRIKLKKNEKKSYSSLSHGKKSQSQDEEEMNLGKYDELGSGVLTEADYKESLIDNGMGKTYPKGDKVGTALHEIFEKSSFSKYSNMSIDDVRDESDFTLKLDKLIDDCYSRAGMILAKENYLPTRQMMVNVLNANLPKICGNKKEDEDFFKLSDIDDKDKKAELEFNFSFIGADANKYFNGFVDLTFRRKNDKGEYVYCILDWKSDSFSGDMTSYYNKEALSKHVKGAYSIQRVLYSYCLIKWISERTAKTMEEVFNTQFGGIYYVFFRGCLADTSNGVYAHTWNSFKDLEDAYNNIISLIRGTNDEE